MRLGAKIQLLNLFKVIRYQCAASSEPNCNEAHNELDFGSQASQGQGIAETARRYFLKYISRSSVLITIGNTL